MRKMPIWVRLISILFFVYGLIMIFFSLVFFGAITAEFEEPIPLAGADNSLFIIIGVALIVVAVLLGLVGYGIWMGKNWARLIAIILASLSGASIIVGFISEGFQEILNNVVPLILNILIVAYLLINNEAKKEIIIRSIKTYLALNAIPVKNHSGFYNLLDLQIPKKLAI